MDTLFISDLHLSTERPAMLDAFRHLLRGPARRTRALYILGDLFEEFWVGTDDITPPNQDIIRELTDFTRSGTRLYIQKGNRDLLIDHRFGEMTGARVLPDLSVINLDGTKVLITHGDLLCTRDLKYQFYRRVVTFPLTRALFGYMPYSTRIRIAHGLRPGMQRSTMQKPGDIIDVEQSTIEYLLKASGVTEIIHGHTHRPGISEFDLDGKRARRTVLGDWYENGKILVCNKDDRKLIPVNEYT